MKEPSSFSTIKHKSAWYLMITLCDIILPHLSKVPVKLPLPAWKKKKKKRLFKAAKKLNTRGLSCAVIFQMKRVWCPELRSDGANAVAEPRQIDQLALLGRGSRLQSEQTPNTAGSAANACTHMHTASCLVPTITPTVTRAWTAQDNLTQSLEQLHPVLICSFIHHKHDVLSWLCSWKSKHNQYNAWPTQM